jgi:hypothetical protein
LSENKGSYSKKHIYGTRKYYQLKPAIRLPESVMGKFMETVIHKLATAIKNKTYAKD